MNLNEASQKALEIAEKRGIHERPHEALKHCAGEVTEALVAYLDYVYDKNKKEEFENELADIVICVLSISAKENIDIEGAIARKMLINEGRIKNGMRQ
jgi:NTP pyrophosphatase (non-canonical NTP hydrolase)